jgi:DNA-binding GntR family transcriptional regulator
MKKLRRTSLSEDAYAVVRALLVDGDRYSAGDKVSVEELSRELGVSRTPLWGQSIVSKLRASSKSSLVMVCI